MYSLYDPYIFLLNETQICDIFVVYSLKITSEDGFYSISSKLRDCFQICARYDIVLIQEIRDSQGNAIQSLLRQIQR
jgi:hypothetical protein